MAEPKIPDDIFSLIEEEANKSEIYGPAEGFTKLHIREILRSIEVPLDLQIDYISKPRKQNRFHETPLTSLRKFTERWKSIKYRLTGIFPVILSQRTYLQVQQYFGGYIKIWQYVNPPKDHSHFYHYNFIIIKTLQYIDYLNEQSSIESGLVDTFRKEWLLPTTKEKLETLHKIWEKIICVHMNFKVCLPTEIEEEWIEINKKKHKMVYLKNNVSSVSNAKF